MKKPLKTFIYKLLACGLILLAGYFLGLVHTETSMGVVVPAMCTVYAIGSLWNYIKEVRKANDKSKVDFL